MLYVQFRNFPHKVFREKHFPSRNILSGVIPAGMYMSEKLPCTTVSSSITKEGTMVQINFLFIYFNMHLHRYLFKVLRIILPEILNIMITSYKIYFPILSASVRLSLIPSTIITKFLTPMHNTWFCCHRATSGAYSFPNVYIEYHTSVFSMKKFYVFFDCKVTEDSLNYIMCTLSDTYIQFEHIAVFYSQPYIFSCAT